MAKSTSTYGKVTNNRSFTVQLAENGLCATHRTAILSDGECWDCEGLPVGGIYEPDARSLADQVRSALKAAEASKPELVSMLRVSLNAARSDGTLDASTLEGALTILRVVPEPATVATPVRTNKFAGRCTSCNGWVEAEAGQLLKVNDKWAVQHTGTCPATVATVATLPKVPEGRYAIASTGDNDLVFYAVEASEQWGLSVRMIVGGHLDTYVRRANIAGILDRILTDSYDRPEQSDTDDDGPYTIPAGSFSGPAGAALRYADEFTHCSRCNRSLTDRQSRMDGIGPVCITK